MRTGRQTPTWDNLPEIERSDGTMAARLAAPYFGEPMEWQSLVLDAILARDERDKYLMHSIGLAVPRQNGKSWDVRARCFYGIVADGERILYTCQHGDTSDEMFKCMADPFENEDNEELHDMLLYVRRTNGQQAIYLKNGGYIRFSTRTNSISRGRSYDVVIYDEAQDLTGAQQAASLFAISASRKHNTQVIYLGTPPDPTSPGDVFKMLHDHAHEGSAQAMAWMEWSVPEIGDVSNRDRWYETNPGLGLIIDESAVEGELTTSADTFARERLGWWSAQKAARAIPGELWDSAAVGGHPDGGKRAYGVKFAPDGSLVALSVCVRPEDAPAHVELVDARPLSSGISWVESLLIERAEKTACVVIDGRNGSDALVSRIMGEYPSQAVVPSGTKVIVAASNMFLEGLRDGQVTHWDSPYQKVLDDSAKACVRRDIGKDGGWGFGGDGSIPVESASLAYYGAMTTKRDPEGGCELA